MHIFTCLKKVKHKEEKEKETNGEVKRFYLPLDEIMSTGIKSLGALKSSEVP